MTRSHRTEFSGGEDGTWGIPGLYHTGGLSLDPTNECTHF